MKNFEKNLCVIEDCELENVVGGKDFFKKYGNGLRDLNKALFVPTNSSKKSAQVGGSSTTSIGWAQDRKNQFQNAHNNMQDTGVKVAVYGTEAAGAGVLGAGAIAAAVGVGFAVKKFAFSK